MTGAARGSGRGSPNGWWRVGTPWSPPTWTVRARRRTASEIGAAVGLRAGRPGCCGSPVQATTASDRPADARFNNAGVGDDDRLADLTDEQVRRLVGDLLAVCGDAGGPGVVLRPQKRGDTVNTASLSGPTRPGFTGARRHQARDRLGDDVGLARCRAARVHALCRRRAGASSKRRTNRTEHRSWSLRLAHPLRRRDRGPPPWRCSAAAGGPQPAGLARRPVRTSTLAPSMRSTAQVFAARGRRASRARRGVSRDRFPALRPVLAPPPLFKTFEHLFVSLLENVRTCSNVVCSIERLLGANQ